MERQEIIDFWGPEKLIRWPQSATSALRVPEQSKSFLCEVGLPIQEDWNFRFDGNDRFPPLKDKPHYRRIGIDDPMPFCLDEEGNGRVIEVTDKLELFVNSSVELFAECLLLFQQYRNAAYGRPKEEGDQMLEITRARIETADPPALADPNTFWSLIVEQMEYELL